MFSDFADSDNDRNGKDSPLAAKTEVDLVGGFGVTTGGGRWTGRHGEKNVCCDERESAEEKGKDEDEVEVDVKLWRKSLRCLHWDSPAIRARVEWKRLALVNFSLP